MFPQTSMQLVMCGIIDEWYKIYSEFVERMSFVICNIAMALDILVFI